MIHITIVNRDITRNFDLNIDKEASWQEVSDAISVKEGYSRDDLPKWDVVWEHKTPWGYRIAEFYRNGYACIIIAS